MKLNEIDYKGKYTILQDPDVEDYFDYVVGEVDSEQLTDEDLKDRIAACEYYGIPVYIGGNKDLLARIALLKDNQKR